MRGGTTLVPSDDAVGGDVHGRRIRNTEIEVIEYPLGLHREPAALLEHFDNLAHRAWQRAAGMTVAA